MSGPAQAAGAAHAAEPALAVFPVIMSFVSVKVPAAR